MKSNTGHKEKKKVVMVVEVVLEPASLGQPVSLAAPSGTIDVLYHAEELQTVHIHILCVDAWCSRVP